MFLSDIEIVGFKSFAQKTKLRFNEGISAVVGPNGCGKSNVVDAVRWVLGEKKASALRSDVMENVIFNGTKDRKQLGMAEVSLTLVNNKHVLPVEYDTVNITRRLFRNGESEYLLNKTTCRLKDILDLFMDTGIGADSYSVIELKMVEALLSARVDDRRAMFEEAAGIKKYKSRRKDAMKRLESVVLDIERVEDILQEVRKNVNSLSRQAAKTRRYNQLLQDLKDLDTRLMKHDFDISASRKTELETEVKSLEANKIKIEFELSDREKELDAMKQKITTNDAELKQAQENESSVTEQLARLKQKIAVSKEKHTYFTSGKERLIREIEESTGAQQNSEAEVSEMNVELTRIKESIESENQNYNDAKLLRDNASGDVARMRQSVQKTNESVMSMQNRINSLRDMAKKDTERRSSIERKLESSHEEIYKYESQIEEIESDKQRLQELAEELTERRTEAEKELNVAMEEKASLTTENDSLRLKVQELRNEIKINNSQLDFLNSIFEAGESAKYLLKNNSWASEGEILTLAESIAIDDELRPALAAALGEYAGYFVVKSRDEAFAAIDLLNQNGKGNNGFIIPDAERTASEYEKYNDEGFIGWFTDLIRCDDNLRGSVGNLLGKFAAVKDREAALEIVKTGMADFAATLDGETVSAISTEGGSGAKKRGSAIGKKEKIALHKKNIEKLNDEIRGIENRIEEIRSRLSELDINDLKSSLAAIESQIVQNTQKLQKLDLSRQSCENAISVIEENKLRFSDEIDELSGEIEDLNSQAEELQSEFNENKVQYSGLLEELKQLERKLAESEEALKTREIHKAELSTELRNKESALKNQVQSIAATKRKIEEKRAELENFDAEKAKLEREISISETEYSELERKYHETRSNREFIAERKNSLQEQYEQMSAEYNRVRKEYDKLKEKLYEQELKLNEISVKITSLIDKAMEQYQLELAGLVLPELEEPFDEESSKATLKDLKSKLNELGSVNFMALEEYDTQKERLDFYEKQLDDLKSAKKTLLETIDEINTSAQTAFQETFDKIQANFQMLFKKLFGDEGEARIELESDDLLESDILIHAKPPNKRPNTIQSLSGGEKTLTAIALLFAIYLVKPSPFCILDEVDAPLDDTNIDKFIGLIKEFSQETQFLIVTHNKRSMEAADTLYGITQEEQGVSKVVTVRFNETAA